MYDSAVVIVAPAQIQRNRSLVYPRGEARFHLPPPAARRPADTLLSSARVSLPTGMPRYHSPRRRLLTGFPPQQRSSAKLKTGTQQPTINIRVAVGAGEQVPGLQDTTPHQRAQQVSLARQALDQRAKERGRRSLLLNGRNLSMDAETDSDDGSRNSAQLPAGLAVDYAACDDVDSCGVPTASAGSLPPVGSDGRPLSRRQKRPGRVRPADTNTTTTTFGKQTAARRLKETTAWRRAQEAEPEIWAQPICAAQYSLTSSITLAATLAKQGNVVIKVEDDDSGEDDRKMAARLASAELLSAQKSWSERYSWKRSAALDFCA